MATAHPRLTAVRDARLLRIAAATFEPAAGLIALLSSAAAVGYLVDTDSPEPARWPYGLAFAIGSGLVAVWALGHRRRAWTIVLSALSAVFAAGMALITVLTGRAIRFDPHLGYWDGTWDGAAAVILWLLVAITALIEYRLPRPETEGRPPAWSIGGAITAALVVAAALALLVGTMPAWEIRANSLTTPTVAAAAADPSRLSGTTRWSVDADAGSTVLTTAAGLAVPVASNRDHNAGVILIDPVTGTIRWRYELRGTDTAPDLSSTDQGRAIVVDFDETELPSQVPHRLFTLKAASGTITAFWPDDVVGSDPPVRFRSVPRGTNSVSGMSVGGRKLWTFKPERCSDPRGAVSTPAVIVVPTRKCVTNADRPAYQLRGFDARTGDQLWIASWDQESPPEQLLVRAGFEVETTGATVQRRDLRTGKIDWSTRLPCARPGQTSASQHTLFIHSCSGDGDHADVLQAYDLSTGKRLWQRQLHRQTITALAAIDDRRIMALMMDTTGEHRDCRANLVSTAAVRTLRTFTEDNRANDPAATYRPGLVQCADSSIYRLAGSLVLRIHLSGPPGSGPDDTRYRFLGLS